MFPLIAAIFAASLLGSLHCAGMCGAFLAIAVGGDLGASKPAARVQAAYHVGRLLSYVALGAAAGSAGRLLDLAGSLAGIRPIAAALAASAMILFGLTAFLRTRGVHLSRLPLPTFVTSLSRAGYRVAMRHPPLPRAFAIGLLTTLLPCGWLYAFAITAAGTGSAGLGAVTMAAFWAGTLPVLVALGTGLQRLSGPLARRLPAVTSLVLVAVGLYTLAGRLSLDPAALASVVPTAEHSAPCCETHDHDR